MKRLILTIAVLLTAAFLAGAQNPLDGAIFRQEGIASWYGSEFSGRPTASGEIFNPSLLTAAHPTLAFGTLLRVTNTHNNRQVMVRINDRGPYVTSRIIYVSQAAAEQLDMISTGTAPVVIESLGPVSSSGAAAQAPPPAAAQVLPPAAAQVLPPAAVQVLPQTAAPMPPPAAAQVLPPAAAPMPPQTTAQALPPTAVPYSGGGVIPVAPAEPYQPASRPTTAPPGPGVDNPVAVVTPLPAEAPGPAPAAFPSRPIMSPQSPRTVVSAVVIPSMPAMGTGKQYRVQVGAFRVARYASEAFDKLKSIGLNPAYERYAENYRVVIPGVRPEQIPSLAEQLGTAGFPEILVREEAPGGGAPSAPAR